MLSAVEAFLLLFWKVRVGFPFFNLLAGARLWMRPRTKDREDLRRLFWRRAGRMDPPRRSQARRAAPTASGTGGSSGEREGSEFIRADKGRATKLRSRAEEHSALLLQLLHYALNQLFGIRQVLHNDLDIHDGLARPALALTIDSVLPDQGHRIGNGIHGYRQASPGYSHHGFVVLQLFLLVVENRHDGTIPPVQLLQATPQGPSCFL